ncbi:hypothetical protein EP227_06870 [bacterium]|nr:MAG: hypothetical protein EP227_06870 [bacterium]
MTMRANIADHISIQFYSEKVAQSAKLFVKKACTLAEKLATATVVIVITGLIIFALYLGLLQFAFIIFC